MNYNAMKLAARYYRANTPLAWFSIREKTYSAVRIYPIAGHVPFQYCRNLPVGTVSKIVYVSPRRTFQAAHDKPERRWAEQEIFDDRSG
jgi:hypothetical protein